MAREILPGWGGNLELVGEGEGGDALEGVFLNLRALAGNVTRFKLHAEGRIAKQAVAGPLSAQVVTKEQLRIGLGSGPADAGGGSDRENERDDGDGQQHAENDAKVMLEGALNPGNHGRKRAS